MPVEFDGPGGRWRIHPNGDIEYQTPLGWVPWGEWMGGAGGDPAAIRAAGQKALASAPAQPTPPAPTVTPPATTPVTPTPAPAPAAPAAPTPAPAPATPNPSPPAAPGRSASLQSIIDGLPAGWTAITGVPQEEIGQIKNPAASVPGAPANTPAVINQGTGRWFILVQGPGGQQSQVFLRSQPMPGTRPNHQAVMPTTGVSLGPNQVAYAGSPDSAEWTQDAPLDTTGAAKAASPIDKWKRLDVSGNEIKAGDTTTKPAYLVDPADPTHRIDLATAASQGGTIVESGGLLFVVRPDGSSAPATGPDGKQLTRPVDHKQFQTQNGTYDYDPTTNVYTLIPGTQAVKDDQYEVRNGLTYVKRAGTTEWVLDSSLPAQNQPTTIYNDPNSDSLVWYDNNGKEVSRQKKVGWHPPQPSAVTQPGNDVPFIYSWDNAQGKLVQQPNSNYRSVTQATTDLAKQLGIAVAMGSMSETQAQALIQQATQALTARSGALSNMASAATAGLGQINQAAATGAGMLNQRVSSATGLLQNLAQIPQGGAVAPGTAGMLRRGVQAWTTELGGGEAAYQAAANLVQRADPGGKLGAHAAGMYAALGQALERYADLTGQQHPLAQAVLSGAPAGNQAGGMPAPPASFGSNVVSPSPVLAGTSGIGVGPTSAPGGVGFVSSPMRAIQQPVAPPPMTMPDSAGLGVGPTNAPMGVGFSSPYTPPQPTVNINFMRQ